MVLEYGVYVHAYKLYHSIRTVGIVYEVVSKD
jgi:hypothetical protein